MDTKLMSRKLLTRRNLLTRGVAGLGSALGAHRALAYGGSSGIDPRWVTDYNTSFWWPFGSPISDYVAQIGWNNTNGRVLVSPILAAERNHIILIISNSNGGSFCQGPLYTPTHAKVQQVNIYDGGVYQVADPILGASSPQRGAQYGSIWGVVGDKLIDQGYTDRVIFIPIGIGSSDQVRWIPPDGSPTHGIFHQRILIAIRHMIRLGYLPGHTNVTKVFCNYSAGVTDCLLSTTTQEWITWFDSGTVASIYPSMVAAGLTPDRTFLSIETKTTFGYVDPNRAAIRAAQIGATNGTTKVQGPDIDAFDDTYRYDGAHFISPTGRDLFAQAWVNAYAPYM